MVRKIIAETPLSDINPGSVFLSLLEACASQDFDNNIAILNLLELLNVDSIRNNDLDNKAADLGLQRFAAITAMGTVQIQNTNIAKQSTVLYSLKPAPISGQTVLFVNNTSGWATSGTLYIGRGTNSFEGPIPYTSITVFPTYSQINLGAALQKEHLLSDVVINSQGQPDRVIPAGTIIKIPANNQNPEILYKTIRDGIIPSGEDHVDDILVVAQTSGTQGNALINTIRQFDSAPFVGAAVTNLIAFSTGSDIETDVELRNRVKAYASSLARGTSPAILNAVINLSDPDENKRVSSAILTEPVVANTPSILYIDDGNGFQPSQSGQTVDTLLSRANGTEEFLQLANYPLPRAQVVNGDVGPFAFFNQTFLRVAVDGVEETITFTTSDFVNISVATIFEIVSAINKKAVLFKARVTENSSRILLFPVDVDAETIQVVGLRETDDETLYANNVLNFPVKEVSYIALFQNSTRLHQREKIATVETVTFALWNLLAPGNLILSVDGTPGQDQSFTLSDFPGISSFALLTLEDWALAINNKFAGVTAISTPNQTIQIKTNKRGTGASVEVLGGSYLGQMFSTNPVSAVGRESQFEINRSTGNIRLLTDIVEGDIITAGIADAKGFVVSAASTSGTYNFDLDDAGRQSQMVICPDSTYCEIIAVDLTVDETLVVSDEGNSVMRIMASDVKAFRNIQPGQFIYIAYRGGINWMSLSNTGLFKVIRRGGHLTPSTDTYIEVLNNNITPESVTVEDTTDMKAFKTDVYPQLWTSDYLTNPIAASLSDVVQSIGTALVGVKASIFRTNSVKITSTTEENGSIAIPVSVGKVSVIFLATQSVQENNSPLIASKTSSKDMVGFIKFRPIVSQNSYLGRTSYPSVHASLSADADPDAYPYSGPYAELITSSLLTDTNVDMSDLVMFSKGDNTKLTRAISTKPTNTTVGTQQGAPRTLFDHVINDEVQVFNSLQLSQDDNVVVVMDQDATIKTITIPASRTGQINSGSGAGSFIPTSTEFSADDEDNEPGVDFSTLNVWGTSINKTDFSDYRVLMRARNWYSSGGTAASLGKFMIRAVEYGANGNLFRFAIEYPATPNLSNTTVLVDTPSFNKLAYKFASGADRATAIPTSTNVVVTGPYNSPSVNFPAGAATSGNYYDLTWAAGSFTAIQVNDVLSTFSGCGFSLAFLGQFGIKAKSGNTIRVYAPNFSATTLTVTNPNLIHIFPLQKTTVNDIVSKINQSNIMVAAAISSPSASIVVSTFEDQYTYASNATALGYGHNPTVSSLQGFVALYDGVGDIRAFSNSNPNFTLKTPLILSASGVSASIYRMDTAVNEDSSQGEYFKLVPATIKNVKHHFTQKALSQLPIVADISIADNGKRVQIVSKQLGGKGAIEILGGQANLAQTNIIGQSVAASDTSGSYLLSTLSAFPNSYAKNDIVKISNRGGVKRANQFVSSGTFDVTALTSDRSEYYYNPITTNFVPLITTFTIADVSSSYTDFDGNPLAAGMIWRWTHSIGSGESISLVKPGHQVFAKNCTGWANTNQIKIPGDGTSAGFTIIAVDDVSHTFDVVNPFGRAMSATTAGAGTVTICPVPRNRWNLKHCAPTPISSLQRVSNVITVQTTTTHNLNTGANAIIKDSLGVVVDGTYGPITVTGPQTFTFANSGSNITELNIGATAKGSAFTKTAYRLQKLGLRNLVRLSLSSGDSPRFADAGVAVDDYLVIQGKTFSSSNNGVHRVIAVDNTSMVFELEAAVENTNRLIPFNNNTLAVTWTVNSNILQGSAGTFKNLSDGVWVKKADDDDSLFLQVTGSDTSNYLTATKVFLGQQYAGVTGSAFGISYDMTTGYDAGVLLDNVDDIIVYEGDSAFKTDKLNVQSVVNALWFNPKNTGQFDIIEIGNNPADCRPFLRVNNSVAVTETNRALSGAPEGFNIIENDLYKYETYRTVANSVVSDVNNLNRNLYMLPDARADKISESNNSVISHVGKLGYDLITSTGVDGYLFYTGLLRRVQRTIDGFAPDPTTFAERRALGSRIEILPPLIKNISLILTVTTNEGSTIQDISNNVKSSIIDYVNGLGVGEDVILSAITAAVMKVKGVAAVTFNTPSPASERITIASNEKALIFADMIGIA